MQIRPSQPCLAPTSTLVLNGLSWTLARLNNACEIHTRNYTSFCIDNISAPQGPQEIGEKLKMSKKRAWLIFRDDNQSLYGIYPLIPRMKNGNGR